KRVKRLPGENDGVL
ncbi:unnamed protein product, partial [Discula destructiva]